jgi:hypothetical protein
MYNLIPENLAFNLQCKECEYNIEASNIGFVESLVSISEHIEKFEHLKYELEIYDFDLEFVKETRDVIKIFEEIDDSLLLTHITTKLKALGYENTGNTIKNAIKNDILNIDDVEDNDIYLALTDFGEDLWELIKKE